MAYIILLKRDDFNSLFKYGRIYINPQNSLYLANDIEEYKKDPTLLYELFKERDDFEMVFEYLMILYVTEAEDSKSLIRIENVLGVYALDDQSVKSLSVRLDSKVVINPPLWPDAMNEIRLAKIRESCYRGVNNVWKIFRLEEADKQRCSQIVTDSFIKEFAYEAYNDEMPFGDKPIWVYLLRYQRHEMYPQNDLGYFLDTVHVFTSWHFKDSNQMKTEATDVYNKLMLFEGRRSYSGILDYMNSTPEIASFVDRAGMDGFYRVAPLYLKLLEPFRERGIDLNQTIGGIPFFQQIENLKKYGFEFCLAAYLLGIILGYEKTSDALYDSLQLNIFKKEESEVLPFPSRVDHKEDDKDSDSSPKVETTEVTDEKNDTDFLTPPSSKRKATKDDILSLDSIKQLDVLIPCDIKCGNGKNDKQHITSYKELLETLASQQSKSWKLYNPRKK